MYTPLCNSIASSCTGDATIKIPIRGISNGQNSQLFHTPHPPPIPLSVKTSSTRCVGIAYASASNRGHRREQERRVTDHPRRIEEARLHSKRLRPDPDRLVDQIRQQAPEREPSPGQPLAQAPWNEMRPDADVAERKHPRVSNAPRAA